MPQGHARAYSGDNGRGDLARLAGAIFLLIGFAIFVGVLPARAETRMALLIGNSNYQNAPRLSNPPNDVSAVAAAMRQVGFTTVEVHRDLGKVELEHTLHDFASKSRDADVLVIYYAGHGLEMGGVNYLVPVDARLTSDKDVEFEGVPLDLVLHTISHAHRLKLVVLDACRNNPFLNSMTRSGGTRAIGRGLARVEPEGGDTLVAFAAREGSTADDGSAGNSPFAKALSKELVKPGIEIRILFGRVRDDVMEETGNRQVPAVYGSLGGIEFYFVPPAGATVHTLVPAAPLDPRLIEKDVWDSVKDTNDPLQLQIYLDQYPTGMFASIAKAKLQAQRTSTQVASIRPPAPAETYVPQTPTVRLSPEWRGTYYYTSGQAPASFDAHIRLSGSDAFSGDVDNEYINNVSLHAYVTEGRVIGRRISWTKTYDGRNGLRNSVLYQGEISPDGSTITGTWSTEGIHGSFVMYARR